MRGIIGGLIVSKQPLRVPPARAEDGMTWTREDGVVFIYKDKEWRRLDEAT